MWNDMNINKWYIGYNEQQKVAKNINSEEDNDDYTSYHTSYFKVITSPEFLLCLGQSDKRYSLKSLH